MVDGQQNEDNFGVVTMRLNSPIEMWAGVDGIKLFFEMGKYVRYTNITI